jgi:SagB-type dehydrogenase family enzyme
MTPDHGNGGREGAELWSLREDVQVQLKSGGGSLRLQSQWGELTIQRPSALVREALRRMLLGPISLENVVSARDEPAGGGAAASSLGLLHHVLDQLQPLIIRTLGIESGQPLLSVVPLTPNSRFHPEPIPPDTRVRLSAFAQLRTDGREYHLESPLSLHRVQLHRPEAISLLASLGRPTAAAASVSAWPYGDFLAADALAYLVAVGMVVAEHDAGGPDIVEDTSQAGWSAVDLSFHTRSNRGRHDHPVGPTYPLGRDGSPEPVAKAQRAGPAISLHRPTWESLYSIDPPLAVVMEARRSTRWYGTDPVTVEELGDLLYRTVRIRSVITPPEIPADGPADSRPDHPDSPAGERDPRLSDRPYPGGGACYELELYVTARHCSGLPHGVYHYDPLDHRLELVNSDHKVTDDLLTAAAKTAAIDALPPVLITLTARFQRVGWKYEGVAYSTVLKDVGVLLQSLYLVCTAMGLAPCALGPVHLDLTARAFGADWRLEPSVGQFILGRAPGTLPEPAWHSEPVNDPQWADYARALLQAAAQK